MNNPQHRIVYFDNCATTCPLDEIIEKIKEQTKRFGNPSSLHLLGVESEQITKNARQIISQSLNVSSGEIYFTSGGTEANNLAIMGYVHANKKNIGTLVTSVVEHPSVLNIFKIFEKSGFDVKYLSVHDNGTIKIEELEEILQNQKVSLVSVMHVNNEVGSINPIEKLLYLKKQYGFTLHLDCVQGYLKESNHLYQLADMCSISGHKIHALKGIGVLYIKKGIKVAPLFYGGGQERNIRSGTENLIGIWSLGVAVNSIMKESKNYKNHLQHLKQYLYTQLKENVAGVFFNSTINENLFSSHILNISIDKIPSEVLLHALEEKGIFVSIGSACSSRKKERSYVLKAMMVNSTLIDSSIRISFSHLNTQDEIDYFVKSLIEVIQELRR